MEHEKAFREQRNAMVREIRYLDEKLNRNGITDREPSLLRFANDMPFKVEMECLQAKLDELREKWRSFQRSESAKRLLVTMLATKECIEEHEDQLDEKQRELFSRVKRSFDKLADKLS